jgi:ParB family chromosome partitioning protein
MAAGRQRGLGRGLSALLGEVEAPSGPPTAQASAGAREIPIELIHRNPDQPRVYFDQGELEELAGSLKQKGVLQPILVRPSPSADGEFQIVAGERRWRAAQIAGLLAVPALVKDFGDDETLEVALIENVQRADLNPLEEAAAYQVLMGLGGRTQEDVAQVVGKSRSHVANAMRLLQLPEAVQAMVRTHALSAGHARALVGAPDAEALAREIVDKGLNVRETESLARKASAGRERSGGRPPGKPADTVALERDLSERIGLYVEIQDRAGKGEVRIRYATLEQLDDLCRRLTGRT